MSSTYKVLNVVLFIFLMVTFSIEQDYPLWLQSYSHKPIVDGVQNSHDQRHKLFPRFKMTQTFKYPPSGNFRLCIFPQLADIIHQPPFPAITLL